MDSLAARATRGSPVAARVVLQPFVLRSPVGRTVVVSTTRTNAVDRAGLAHLLLVLPVAAGDDPERSDSLLHHRQLSVRRSVLGFASGSSGTRHLAAPVPEHRYVLHGSHDAGVRCRC